MIELEPCTVYICILIKTWAAFPQNFKDLVCGSPLVYPSPGLDLLNRVEPQRLHDRQLQLRQRFTKPTAVCPWGDLETDQPWEVSKKWGVPQ
jgi:hypothetical protein